MAEDAVFHWRLTAKAKMWRAHVEAVTKSGANVPAYCVSNGLTASAFYTWKKRFERQEILPSVSQPVIEFIPVKVSEGQPVQLPNRVIHSRKATSSPLSDPKWVAEFTKELMRGGS